MLAKDSVRNRLDSEHGISFTEFSYSLLQANDFRHLYEHEGVELQAGGSDQWGNIVAGVDLIRRATGRPAPRADAPADHEGRRHQVRQDASGAPCGSIPAQTSPYQFRQFWMQVDDAMVGRVPADVLAAARSTRSTTLVAEHAAAPERRVAQRALAEEITTLVHGPRGVERPRSPRPRCCSAAIRAAVGEDVLGVLAGELPTVELPADVDGVRVHELLVGAGLAKSNGEVSRLLTQGGVRVNARVLDDEGRLQSSDLLAAVSCSRKGKRDFVLGKVPPKVDVARGRYREPFRGASQRRRSLDHAGSPACEGWHSAARSGCRLGEIFGRG